MEMGIEVTLGSRSFRGLSVKELSYLLSKANDLGISKIDTAPTYGDVEKLIGRATRKSLKNRYQISTKILRNNLEHGKILKRSINRSLCALGVEKIDTLYFHGTNLEFVPLETFCLLSELANNGVIEKIGYSGDNKNLEYALQNKQITELLITLNIVDQKNIKYISKDRNFVAKRVLANHFYDSAQRLDLKKKAVGRYEIVEKLKIYEQRWKILGVEFELHNINQLREKFLRFAAFSPGICGIVVGSSKFENIDVCLADLKKGPLPASEYLNFRKMWNLNSNPDWETIS
jgi:aryl-alcohol dehydrogenase-like predicted oxidoreductase